MNNPYIIFRNTIMLLFKILIILTYHILSYLLSMTFCLFLEFGNCCIPYEICNIPQNLLFILVCKLCLKWEDEYTRLTMFLCQIIYIPIVIWMYPYDSLWQFSLQLDWGIDPYAFIGTYELIYLLFIATPLNILGILIYYIIKKYSPAIIAIKQKYHR